MGYSRWSDADYTSYAKTTNYRSASRDEVFSHRVDEKLDPRNVRVGKGERVGQQLRESIISELNPDPTPIILGLDVTGSMRDVVHQIATVELPKMMTEIHAKGIVSDPHVMFMGIDDVHEQGHGALQVSYFEPDLKIIEQLRKLWLVGNGGGNGSESYDLAWYFAARYTFLENFERTGKPGFLFTFGDEPFPYQTNSVRELETIFGPGEYEPTKPEAALKMARKKFQVFHVSVEKPGYDLSGWDQHLENNHLRVKAGDLSHLTEIVLATMQIANGANIHSVIDESPNSRVLKHAFSNALSNKYS